MARTPTFVFLAAIALLTAPAAHAATPRAGAWEAGNGVSFDVEKGRVVRAILPFECGRQQTRVVTIKQSMFPQVRRGGFHLQHGKLTFSGRFSSRTAAAGSFRFKARGCDSGVISYNAAFVSAPVLPLAGAWAGKDASGATVRLTFGDRISRVKQPLRRTLRAFSTEGTVACEGPFDTQLSGPRFDATEGTETDRADGTFTETFNDEGVQWKVRGRVAPGGRQLDGTWSMTQKLDDGRVCSATNVAFSAAPVSGR